MTDDLISRRAALACFRAWTDKHGDVWTPEEMPEYQRIEALPSVEPEIIRCRDCKYSEQYEVGKWYCIELGCCIGADDGSGFCSNGEKRV